MVTTAVSYIRLSALSSATTRTRRSTGWQSSPAAISSTYVIGGLSSSGHGCSRNRAGLKKSETLISAPHARVQRKRSECERFQSSRAHRNPKRVVLQQKQVTVATTWLRLLG